MTRALTPDDLAAVRTLLLRLTDIMRLPPVPQAFRPNEFGTFSRDGSEILVSIAPLRCDPMTLQAKLYAAQEASWGSVRYSYSYSVRPGAEDDMLYFRSIE